MEGVKGGGKSESRARLRAKGGASGGERSLQTHLSRASESERETSSSGKEMWKSLCVLDVMWLPVFSRSLTRSRGPSRDRPSSCCLCLSVQILSLCLSVCLCPADSRLRRSSGGSSSSGGN